MCQRQAFPWCFSRFQMPSAISSRYLDSFLTMDGEKLSPTPTRARGSTSCSSFSPSHISLDACFMIPCKKALHPTYKAEECGCELCASFWNKQLECSDRKRAAEIKSKLTMVKYLTNSTTKRSPKTAFQRVVFLQDRLMWTPQPDAAVLFCLDFPPSEYCSEIQILCEYTELSVEC